MRIHHATDGAGRWRVFLNDEEVRFVIEANEEAFYVVVPKRDAKGNVVINMQENRLEEQLLYGQVRIAPREESKKEEAVAISCDIPVDVSAIINGALRRAVQQAIMSSINAALKP